MNFTSAGLVASAIVVVMEVTAPSGVPPGVFASPSHGSGPSSPVLPFEFTAPASAREPVSALVFGVTATPTTTATPITTAAATSGSGVSQGGTASVLSHAAAPANTQVPTTALPPAVQNLSAIAAPAGRADNGSGNSSDVTNAGVAAADGRFSASGNAPNRSDGNGNGGNGNGGNGNADHGAGGDGHGQGQSFTNAGSPAVQGTFGSSVPAGATAPPQRGPAPSTGTGDPSSRGSQEGGPSAAGHSWGDGQDEQPGGPPGHPSHARG